MASPWAVSLAGIIRPSKLTEPTNRMARNSYDAILTTLVCLFLPVAEVVANRRAVVIAAEAVRAGGLWLLVCVIDVTEREPQPPPVRLDAQHPHAVALALLDDLARIGDVALAQLADVDQPFDAILDPREGAERG